METNQNQEKVELVMTNDTGNDSPADIAEIEVIDYDDAN